jgi:hypothetical protein
VTRGSCVKFRTTKVKGNARHRRTVREWRHRVSTSHDFPEMRDFSRFWLRRQPTASHSGLLPVYLGSEGGPSILSLYRSCSEHAWCGIPTSDVKAQCNTIVLQRVCEMLESRTAAVVPKDDARSIWQGEATTRQFSFHVAGHARYIDGRRS